MYQEIPLKFAVQPPHSEVQHKFHRTNEIHQTKARGGSESKVNATF